MLRTMVFLGALAATLALLGACAPDPGDGGSDEVSELPATELPATDGEELGEPDATLEMTAERLAFDAESYSAPAGILEIELTNDSHIFHDVAIDELDGERVVPRTVAGATKAGVVRLEPGTYTLFCTVSGHRDAGMEAALTVD